MILRFTKSIFQSRKKACISLYNEAKKKRPDKEEYEYLKLILLTKPPFDYQLDSVIEAILKDFKSIEELSNMITKISKDNLWQSRSRNSKLYKNKLEERNKSFFKKFWA